MGRRRKFYVPITRSMPSILASLLTQVMQERRKERQEETLRRFEKGEISGLHAYFLFHPIFCIFILFVAFMFLAYLLGWVPLSDAAFLGGALIQSWTTIGRKP